MLEKINNNLFFSITLVIITSFSHVSLAQKYSKNAGLLLSLGPAIGVYKINTNHAKDPTLKMSAILSVRKEIKLDKVYKTFFLIGGEYFLHGLNFKSYYFEPSSLQLYDKTFSYNYSLVINELGLPLQFKYSFKSENNSEYSPYLMVGYHLRYLLPSNLTITQNGIKIKEDIADVKFKTPFIMEQMNSFISLAFGLQKNSVNRSKNVFFVEFNLRYGFSQYYFEKKYVANSLYINSTHLSMQVGYKF